MTFHDRIVNRQGMVEIGQSEHAVMNDGRAARKIADH
jgi:hypothetical protein